MHDAGALLSNLPAHTVIFQSNDSQSWRLWSRLCSYLITCSMLDNWKSSPCLAAFPRRLVVTLSVPTPSRAMEAQWWLETAAPWRNWTRPPAVSPGPPGGKKSIAPWKQLHFSHTVHWTNIFSSSLDSQTWHVTLGENYTNHSRKVLFKKSLKIWAYIQHLTTSKLNKKKFLKKREKPKKYKSIVAFEQRNAHHTEHPVAEILKFYYWWLLFGHSAGWPRRLFLWYLNLKSLFYQKPAWEACLET